MARSPLHFRHALTHKDPPTPAMEMGAYYDHLLFGTECSAVVSPYDDFRKAEARAWRDSMRASGYTILTQEQHESASLMLDAIRSDSAAQKLLLSGQAQVGFTSTIAGCQVKGLLDWLCSDYLMVVDLKVTTDASERAWQRHVINMGYDVQAAMYLAGVKNETGDDCRFAWIVVEDSPPHAVAVWVAHAGIIRRGTAILTDRLTAWDRCVQSGEWPGYTPEPREIGLPPWEDKNWREE